MQSYVPALPRIYPSNASQTDVLITLVLIESKILANLVPLLRAVEGAMALRWVGQVKRGGNETPSLDRLSSVTKAWANDTFDPAIKSFLSSLSMPDFEQEKD